MAGLADIGRSGIGTTLMQGAMNLSDLETERQNRELTREAGLREAEKFAMEKRAFEYREAQQKKRDEFMKTPRPVAFFRSLTPGAHDSTFNMLLEDARRLGVTENIGGEETGTLEGGLWFMELLNKNPFQAKKYADNEIQAWKGESDKLKQILEQTQANPKTKPEELQDIAQKYKMAEDNHQRALIAGNDLYKLLQELEAKEAIKAKYKEHTPQMQTWYEIDSKGNVGKSYTLDANKSEDIGIIKDRGLVPANDPRIKQNIRDENLSQLSAAQTATIAHNLRTELRQNPYVRDFQDVSNKFNVMERAYKASQGNKNFVAIDQALITLFNKMTDPQSVVRESEYIRTPENISLINRFVGAVSKYGAGGAGISQKDREALIDMARQFYESYAESYDQVVTDYELTAKQSGISPQLIGIPFRKSNRTKAKSEIPDPLGIRR